ncbi:MAG: NAD+ kinase, partial [Kiritimatiellia bacterium]
VGELGEEHTMIVYDPRNPIAVAHAGRLKARITDACHQDITIVIGGDGFLLHTVAELGFDKVYLGLNAGRVGFLLNDVDHWDRVIEQLQTRSWRPWTFPVLRAECRTMDGETIVVHAVNDVYLERASGQTARLSLTVDEAKVVETLVCDGIIVSTALGSTAYNFSAGGPACHPTLQVLAVTPICPHLPKLSPFALPLDGHVEVGVQLGDKRPVRAVADGRYVAQVEHVSIRVADVGMELAYLDGHDFTARMVRKILHP